MSPEQRVLQEVLDTENVYVTDLKQVVEVRLVMELQVQKHVTVKHYFIFLVRCTYMVT